MRTLIGLILIPVLLFGSTRLLKRIDDSRPQDWFAEKFTYLPSGKLLKPMVLDFDEAAASLLWVKGMTYFADAYFLEKSYAWMGHILDIVTTLNPRFRQAYDFSGVMLTREKSQLPQAVKILERGIREFPDDWRLRLFFALAQVKLDSNYLKAAEYLKPVARSKDVPPHIKTLAASFMSRGGEKRMALAFLVDQYRNSASPMHDEILVEKMVKLYEENQEIDSARVRDVERILAPVKADARAEILVLGVLHDYLGNDLSDGSRRVMQALGIPVSGKRENPP